MVVSSRYIYFAPYQVSITTNVLLHPLRNQPNLIMKKWGKTLLVVLALSSYLCQLSWLRHIPDVVLRIKKVSVWVTVHMGKEAM